MGAAGSTAAGSGATSAGAEDNRVTVCPSGNSTKFLPLHLHSPSFTLKTHEEGTTLGENVDCKMDYVMGNCNEAMVSCDVDMIGMGENCEDGDRVSITADGETTNLCGTMKKKNITKVGEGLLTIHVKTDGENRSNGGKCTVRCNSEFSRLSCSQDCENDDFDDATEVCGDSALEGAEVAPGTGYYWMPVEENGPNGRTKPPLCPSECACMIITTCEPGSIVDGPYPDNAVNLIEPWNDCSFAQNGNLRLVKGSNVHSGLWIVAIDWLQFKFAKNGESWLTEKHGGVGGIKAPKCTILNGDMIKEIWLQILDPPEGLGPYISGLSLKSKNGVYCGNYGLFWGTPTYLSHTGYHLSYISGYNWMFDNQTKVVNSLTFHWVKDP